MKKAEKQYLLDKLEESAETHGYYYHMAKYASNRESYRHDEEIADHVARTVEEIALEMGITYAEKEEATDKGFTNGEKYAKRDLQFVER